jgi:hypothetical protein
MVFTVSRGDEEFFTNLATIWLQIQVKSYVTADICKILRNEATLLSIYIKNTLEALNLILGI